MTDKTRRYFSGSSLEAAVMEAARYFGVEPERLDYERHAKRHGFLRGRRSVVIEVDPESPLRPADAAPPSTAASPTAVAGPPAEPAVEQEAEQEVLREIEHRPPPAEPVRADREEEPEEESRRRPVEDAELEEAVHEALERVYELTALDLEAEVFEGDEQLEIELSGPDEARLLEDRGALIVSIQHLLPRLVRGVTGRSFPCRVDAAGFHAARRRRLRGLAERSADEVRRSGQPWEFEPMSPDERRIIHLALADDPEVETESRGRGFFKRITVRPAR